MTSTLALLMLAGTAASPSSAAPHNGTVEYRCSGGFRFSAQFKDNAATITTRAGSVYPVHRVKTSPSESRYESAEVLFGARGEHAWLNITDVLYLGCKPTRATLTPSGPPRRHQSRP
jgi:hypothetical protein